MDRFCRWLKLAPIVAAQCRRERERERGDWRETKQGRPEAATEGVGPQVAEV